jgi:tRNA pseudouridine38-40 synthase
MSVIKMVISYDGSKFHGYAIQPKVRTVQQTIEELLSKILNQKIKIHGSGRTDAYVHAYQQVISFEINDDININNLKKSIIGLLPSDIKLLQIKKTTNNFHARYSAKDKTYIYKINLDKTNPFIENYSLNYFKKIDLNKIKSASKLFVGQHNFLSFSITEIADTIRTINFIKITKNKNLLEIKINANGFLRGMVRMIVGSLLDINENKKTNDDINNLFNNPKKGSSIRKVNGSGLYLYKVNY